MNADVYFSRGWNIGNKEALWGSTKSTGWKSEILYPNLRLVCMNLSYVLYLPRPWFPPMQNIVTSITFYHPRNGQGVQVATCKSSSCSMGDERAAASCHSASESTQGLWLCLFPSFHDCSVLLDQSWFFRVPYVGIACGRKRPDILSLLGVEPPGSWVHLTLPRIYLRNTLLK